MNIGLHNYEAFFIDYYDGTLSAEKVAELFLFLEEHQELKEEFESFKLIRLDALDEAFPDREKLKRGKITTENISWYLVAHREGDLDAGEQQLLEEFLVAQPAYKKDVSLFTTATLQPDYSVVCPGKESLHKTVPFFIAYRQAIRYGIAAILLLAFLAGSTYLVTKNFNRDEIRVVENPSQISPQKEVPQIAGQDTVLNYPAPIPTDRVTEPVKEQKLASGSSEKETHTGDEEYMASSPEIQNSEQQAGSTNPVRVLENDRMLVEPVAVLIPALSPNVNTAQQIEYRASQVADIKPAPANEEYVTVWQALKDLSVKELKKRPGENGEKILAYADDNAASPGLIDIVGSGIEKITNDKVQIERRKNEKGKTERFRFAVGKFSIEK